MNTFEMRIDRLYFDTNSHYKNIQAFSFGHESCIIKFFKVIRNANLLQFLKSQKNAGKQLRIITPFVPEHHLDEVKNVVQEICSDSLFEDSIIIVNDFGLMNYIHQIDESRQLCLGRNLLACFDYAPWGHKIYESEPVYIQKIATQTSFYDDEKMAFFRQYNITEIEANLTESTTESLKAIQKAGFKINIYQSTFLYGIQRSCYIKRYHPNQACTGVECEYAEKLELDELWCGTGFYKAAENINFPSPLYLRGNQIYGEAHDIQCDWADNIILSPESTDIHKGGLV